MTVIPDARRIDIGAEAERLAAERNDPPSREWGVKHPGGKVTVRADGHAFLSRLIADGERWNADRDCGECAGGTHTLVYRDKPMWRDA